MEATQELDMMKDGARRVQEFLEAKGVEVKHSMMLEALSAGFGSRNWRTVREKLNAPSAPPALTLADLDGERWEVHAFYEDNKQPYASSYEGDTPMQAAMNAQIERIFDEEGSDIIIVSVIDRLTHEPQAFTGDMPDAQIYAFTKMLADLGHAARKQLTELPESRLDKVAFLKERLAAVEILEELDEKVPLGQRNFNHTAINGIDKFTVEDNGGYCEDEVFFLWNSEKGPVDITGTRAVEIALQLILANGIDSLRDKLKLKVYQAQAMLKYAARELNIAMS